MVMSRLFLVSLLFQLRQVGHHSVCKRVIITQLNLILACLEIKRYIYGMLHSFHVVVL